jgi:tetratricopeptide (TPR) repeat protein
LLPQAVASLMRAFALHPDDPATARALADTHYNIGVSEARRGSWRRAMESYAAALEFKRDFPEAFHSAAIAVVHLGDYHSAIALFDEALRLRPRFAEAQYNRATTLAALGRYGDALRSCREALQSNPRLREALLFLAVLVRLVGGPLPSMWI